MCQVDKNESAQGLLLSFFLGCWRNLSLLNARLDWGCVQATPMPQGKVFWCIQPFSEEVSTVSSGLPVAFKEGQRGMSAKTLGSGGPQRSARSVFMTLVMSLQPQ